MGIRYYAYPLAAKFAHLAHIDPEPFLSEDPFADFFFTDGEGRPDMLYLDKCWPWLQGLTQPEENLPAREAYRLFEGEVTHMDGGYTWLPWIRALNPDEVSGAARDLATLNASDVRTLIAGSRIAEEKKEEECEYVTEYLQRSVEFTRRLSDQGAGLVYMIG